MSPQLPHHHLASRDVWVVCNCTSRHAVLSLARCECQMRNLLGHYSMSLIYLKEVLPGGLWEGLLLRAIIE